MLWLASPAAGFLKNKFLWTNWDVDELMERKSEIEKNHLYDVQVVSWPFGNEDWKPVFAHEANKTS
jgi:hypothetical protein